MTKHEQHGQPGAPDWIGTSRYPFAQHWIELNGNHVEYVDEGDGPTLLLLHGNPTWSFMYRNSIQRLHHTSRCIVLDYPGFGLSVPHPGYRSCVWHHA